MRDPHPTILLAAALVLGPATAAGWLLAAITSAAIAAPPADAAARQASEPGAADTTGSPLREVLEAHRRPVALEAGELTGPGGELLLSGAADARYTLVGETHGVAETPPLVAALFRALRPHGYRHLAIEVGPVQAARIGQILAGPRPMETYRAFVREHWPAVPFYVWKEEAELLAEAVRSVGESSGGGSGASVLWGLDYDIMGGRYPLRRLHELAPGPDARAAATRLAERADSLLRRAVATGDLSRALMFSRPASTWTELRRAYDPEPGSEADRILTQLEATARINEAWVGGERWTSNRRRVRLIKDNFLRHRAAADPGARVLVKMGGFHVMRGRTPNNTFDIGNLLSELGRAEAGPAGEDPAAAGGGNGSFHVLVVGGPGRERAAIDPETLGIRRVPTVTSSEGQWAHVLGRAAYPKRWTVLDLRPLRPLLDAGELDDVPGPLEATIFGYDAVVVLAGSTPAGMLLEETPRIGAPGAEGSRR